LRIQLNEQSVELKNRKKKENYKIRHKFLKIMKEEQHVN